MCYVESYLKQSRPSFNYCSRKAIFIPCRRILYESYHSKISSFEKNRDLPVTRKEFCLVARQLCQMNRLFTPTLNTISSVFIGKPFRKLLPRTDWETGKRDFVVIGMGVRTHSTAAVH